MERIAEIARAAVQHILDIAESYQDEAEVAAARRLSVESMLQGMFESQRVPVRCWCCGCAYASMRVFDPVGARVSLCGRFDPVGARMRLCGRFDVVDGCVRLCECWWRRCGCAYASTRVY